jgi:short-subunit dehydrogenase
MPLSKVQASEGHLKSLDHEVNEFGVRVVVIEPAATRTSFETSTAPSDTPLAAYEAGRAKYLKAYERATAVADTAESVAETFVRAARDKTPRLRYPSRRFVPRTLFDKILRSQFGLA